MRRQFSCGHRGKGKFCHRCAAENKQHAANETARKKLAETKQHLQQVMTESGLAGIEKVPFKIAQQAIKVAEAIRSGAPIAKYKGKRLQVHRDTISIPIGHRWRLMCKDQNCQIEPIEIISHETYNHFIN